MRFGGISRSLVDISRNLTSVESSRFLKLVELDRLLRVDISGNFRLVGPGGFSRFRFRV